MFYSLLNYSCRSDTQHRRSFDVSKMAAVSVTVITTLTSVPQAFCQSYLTADGISSPVTTTIAPSFHPIHQSQNRHHNPLLLKRSSSSSPSPSSYFSSNDSDDDDTDGWKYVLRLYACGYRSGDYEDAIQPPPGQTCVLDLRDGFTGNNPYCTIPELRFSISADALVYRRFGCNAYPTTIDYLVTPHTVPLLATATTTGGVGEGGGGGKTERGNPSSEQQQKQNTKTHVNDNLDVVGQIAFVYSITMVIYAFLSPIVIDSHSNGKNKNLVSSLHIMANREPSPQRHRTELPEDCFGPAALSDCENLAATGRRLGHGSQQREADGLCELQDMIMGSQV
ncbi:hypothetical protein QBC32DRAFT_327454 [Pseudoneurospora amorphoporcata]|uniref:Uncharacterized protein n=1 Tax=Pseudoneurospora amorphoporcata TaxID=241081 RepID=A0AAN6NRF9_9PEZI|nr:hypothetical protein QBC32DRAFT_327454 [Pseudoneurospora amorphoporcata]